MYSFVPFALLLIANVLLIHKIFFRRGRIVEEHHLNAFNGRSPSSLFTKKNLSMTRTIITITLLFILMTSPSAFAAIFYSELVKTEFGYELVNLFDKITFSYHGLTFVILYFSNKKFRSEFKRFVGIDVSQSTLTAQPRRTT